MLRKIRRVMAAAAMAAALTVVSTAFAANVPTGVKVPPLGYDSTSVWLMWDRPANGDNVAYYNVYADGQLLGSTTKSSATFGTANIAAFEEQNQALCGNLLIRHSFKAANLKPGTAYQFTVRAVASDGTMSAPSQAVAMMTAQAPKVLSVVQYGAKGDGTTVDTAAIQKAIDACPSGGVVEIPAGVFVSGALTLKSDMTLQIDSNAVLRASTNPADFTIRKGKRYTGLLNAYSAKNVRITGTGTIDGNGWKTDANGNYIKAKNIDNKGWRAPNHVLNVGIAAKTQTQSLLDQGRTFLRAYDGRSTTMQLHDLDNFYMEGVTVCNPAMHLIQLDGDNVTFNNVRLLSYDANNGDGIDFTGQGLIVANSYLDTGDDAINFSAGLGAEAAKRPPVGPAWIFNNYVAHGHGGVVLGSHTASWIEHVLAEDNVFNGTEIAFRCKTNQGSGGGGRYSTFRHNVAKNMVRQGIIFTTKYTDTNAVGQFKAAVNPGYFHDMLIEDCNFEGTKRSAIEIYSTGSFKHKNITFRNVHFTKAQPYSLTGYENVNFENCTLD